MSQVRPVATAEPVTGTNAALTAEPPAPAAAPVAVKAKKQKPAPRPGPRRARLMLTRLDPWSVLKTAFMLALAIAIVIIVAVMSLWWVLETTGVFDSVTRTVNDLTGTTTTAVDVKTLVSFNRVLGVALVLAAAEIVLVTALATLFSFLYNLTCGITGGLEVTLTEGR